LAIGMVLNRWNEQSVRPGMYKIKKPKCPEMKPGSRSQFSDVTPSKEGNIGLTITDFAIPI
jgi:hypothetical protein